MNFKEFKAEILSRAYGSAYICSYNDIEHKLSDKSILRYYYQNKVVLADLNSLSK
jgi:hypothetical protein